MAERGRGGSEYPAPVTHQEAAGTGKARYVAGLVPVFAAAGNAYSARRLMSQRGMRRSPASQ